MKNRLIVLGALVLIMTISVTMAADKNRRLTDDTKAVTPRSEPAETQETAVPASEDNRFVPDKKAVPIGKDDQNTDKMADQPGQPRASSSLPPLTATSADYAITWQSVNAGGGRANSASYEANSTAGQAAIGEASSTNYGVGAGYWYGTAVEPQTCQCPYQSDYDTDGFLTALDLSALIDVLFAGRPEEQDPLCPNSRGDFDCDAFPTALDLSGLIDHLFAGGDGPCDPCAP